MMSCDFRNIFIQQIYILEDISFPTIYTYVGKDFLVME